MVGLSGLAKFKPIGTKKNVFSILETLFNMKKKLVETKNEKEESILTRNILLVLAEPVVNLYVPESSLWLLTASAREPVPND
jgi:hypothetical protein